MSTVRNIKGLVSTAMLALVALGGSQALAGGVHSNGGGAAAPTQQVPNFNAMQQDQQVIQQDQQMRQNFQLQQQLYREQDRPQYTPQQPNVPIMQPRSQ